MNLDDTLICVVGARRSGTHWMQRILATHPDVTAIPTETYLFSHAIAPLFERFQHGTPASPMLGTTYIERDELVRHARALCDSALGRHLRSDLGDPTRLLERTPAHVHHIELIAELYPGARFVHIVRDGRRVVRSLVDQRWGPDDVAAATREWADAIRAGREQGARVPHVVEVQHAQLRTDPRAQIRRVLGALDLDDSDDVLDRAVVEAGVVANTHARTPRPPLSRRQLRTVHRVAGDLLREFDEDGVGLGTKTSGDRPPRPHDSGSHWISNDIHATLIGVNQAIEALRGARPPSDLHALLAPDVSLRLVGGGNDQRWRGRDGAPDLLAELTATGTLASRILWSAQHATHHLHAVVLHTDGLQAADALVVIEIRDTGITDVAVYTFPVGGQGSSTMPTTARR